MTKILAREDASPTESVVVSELDANGIEIEVTNGGERASVVLSASDFVRLFDVALNTYALDRGKPAA